MIVGKVMFERQSNFACVSVDMLRDELPTERVRTQTPGSCSSLVRLDLLGPQYPATLRTEYTDQGLINQLEWDVDNTAWPLLSHLSELFNQWGWLERRTGGPFEIGVENDGLPF